MITLELEDVEIDYCTECGGIWLDAGELELLLGEPQKAKQLLGSFEIESQTDERIRRQLSPGRKNHPLIGGGIHRTIGSQRYGPDALPGHSAPPGDFYAR